MRYSLAEPILQDYAVTTLGLKPHKSASVLVVDDEPSMRSIISSSYSEQGYHVYEAASESEAIALCNSINPDLLVTDVRMPDGDGRTLVERVRSNASLDPIIFCMSSFRDMSAPEVYSRGIDQFFQKPVDLETLLSASTHFLSHRRKRTLRAATLAKGAQESLNMLLSCIKDYLVVLNERGTLLECSHSVNVLNGGNIASPSFSSLLADPNHFTYKIWPSIVSGETDVHTLILSANSKKPVVAEFVFTPGCWMGGSAIFALGRSVLPEESDDASNSTQINSQLTMQARLEMARNAASEARLQLHAIAGYASMLESATDGTREKRYIQSILKSVSSSQNHTTDILDLVSF